MTDLEKQQCHTSNTDLLIFSLTVLGIFLSFPNRLGESDERLIRPHNCSRKRMKSFIFISVDHLRRKNTHDIASQSEARKRKKIRRVSVYYLLRLPSFALVQFSFFSRWSFCYLRKFSAKLPLCSQRQHRPAGAIAIELGTSLGKNNHPEERMLFNPPAPNEDLTYQSETAPRERQSTFIGNYVQPERRSLSIIFKV